MAGNRVKEPQHRSMQRLPNGNTLICEGPSGRVFEVTADKELVWEFVNPFFNYYPLLRGHSNITFRAYRYGYDYEGLKGRTLDPDKVQLVLRKRNTKKNSMKSIIATFLASQLKKRLSYMELNLKKLMRNTLVKKRLIK